MDDQEDVWQDLAEMPRGEECNARLQAIRFVADYLTQWINYD